MADLTGRKFGKLRVTGPSFRKESFRFFTPCKCECGKDIVVREGNLISGNTSSCGCGRVVDLTGKRFGQLVVKNFDRVDDFGSWWLCQCDCGAQKVIRASALKCGDSKSCGHREDLTGERFSRLLVVGKDNTPTKSKRKRVKWSCLCDCGNTTSVSSDNLKSGNTMSCGCHKNTVSVTHGMTGTPTYKVWDHMMGRCTNENDGGYVDYGGRGIKVCDRWYSFANFVADMGIKPEGLEIDRMDNAGDYTPENCRWVTRKVNCRNTRSNRYITLGDVTKCLVEWEEETGIPKDTIRSRLRRHWSIEKTLTTPVDMKFSKCKK
jgi:hypothetical protein